ncbi:MAG TPA: DUF3108 domain-containing protein [Thermoanaerobaculia bacterium]|jgi:hypothetical protein
MKKILVLPALVMTLIAGQANAAGSVERLQYSWSLRGALTWIARVAVPTSGTGTLETTTGSEIDSKLMLTAPSRRDYAVYQSRMVVDGTRTLSSMDGYRFNSKAHEQRVAFDYGEGVARVQKNAEGRTETKVVNLQPGAPRDVLTSIHYLRLHAHEVTTPRTMQIYSGGKPYAFAVTPKAASMLNGRRVLPFTLTPRSDGKRGEVRVWLSDDEHRVPVRIEMEQKVGTLRLDLKS